jgi:uncharacterized protein
MSSDGVRNYCGPQLVRTVEGRQTYFQANPRSPIFEELRGLVRKTFGLTYVLQEALEPIADRIDLAFVFGSVANGTEDSSSDVDLMVFQAIRFVVYTMYLYR